MTFAQFIQKTEENGWFILERGGYVIKYSIGTSITIKGNTYTFRYKHIRSHKFKHAIFGKYDKAYRYLMDSIALEVIDT
jgi:hypothetical protein